jgi:signal transduction histidine kinase
MVEAMSLISGRPALDRLRPGVVELSLALLLFAAGALEAWFDDVPGPGAAQVVAVVLTTVPLAWRTVLPVTTVAVTTGGLAAAAIIGLPFGELLIPGFAPLLAVYSVGVQSTARGLVTAALIGLAAFATAVFADPDARLSHLLLSAGAMLAALAVGRAVRVMGFETDTLEARAAQLERERDEGARVAVEAERARIGRELHDVIGHSISVMGVQAGAVRRVLAPELEREREALLAVERTGRDAVTEMRRLLGFLRPDDDGAAPTEPLPTLKRLDDLVVEVRRAGLDVELYIEGDLDDLSAGRALAAFRIVQEAFTNALRHAPGAHVRAALCSTRGELRIEVVDDGSGRAPASPDRGGYGLIGMRERVTLYGGTLEAGPRPDLGFAVVARLPTADP